MTMTDDAPAQVAPPATPDPAAKADGPSAEEAGKKGKGKKGKKAKEGGGRSNLVPALVLAAGIAAGGYFMGGGAGADAAPETTTTEPAAPEPGDVLELDALTVNLDNGRFLRVKVAFLTTADFHAVPGDSHKGEPARFYPEDANRLRDQLIAMFAGRELASLTGPGGLAATKAELVERANEVLHDQVLEVYVTEFVTQ